MQQLGNALYSYNETAEYFNLNTYVTYVFPELLGFPKEFLELDI
uniref:Uncharacterized protein n=1 Tax=Timema bartmani TaxID=61472 RepID=A0A7R9I9F0_9NEOP|nr:unnamed protein product [Timema bartmani]